MLHPWMVYYDDRPLPCLIPLEAFLHDKCQERRLVNGELDGRSGGERDGRDEAAGSPW
jgi:hypothetical protein